MSQAPAYILAVVCEGAADREIATSLADRVLCGVADWIDPDSLDLHRRWQGSERNISHLAWREVPTLARQRGLKAHGHFGGEPGAPDAWAARLALLVLKEVQPDAALLIRDSDGQLERRIGLEQARADRPWGFPIVLGVAHAKRECWVLAGFHPQTSAEEEALARLRQELGFDPRIGAGRLDASSPNTRRNAKRVLEALTAGNPDRERACWAESDLEMLRTRGQGTGLAEYLDEVRARLVPLFLHGRQVVQG